MALIVGCSRYVSLPVDKQLDNPEADAIDVSRELRRLGYELVTSKPVIDPTSNELKDAVSELARVGASAKTVLFYFSGHGVHIQGDNCLLTSNIANLNSSESIDNGCISVAGMLKVLGKQLQGATKIIILDCCRTELALASGNIKGGEGFGPGFFFAFATSSGAVAKEGKGRRNSPFTEALLRELRTGGANKEIRQLFGSVADLMTTQGTSAQIPWTENSLGGNEVFLSPNGSTSAFDPAVGLDTITNDRGRLDGGKSGSQLAVTLGDQTKMAFVCVPAGRFVLGSPITERRRDEHERIAKENENSSLFWIALQECTQRQWTAVMNQAAPSKFQSPDLPAEQVSYTDAEAFCEKATSQLGLRGWRFALPTEEQWENACRAGTTTPFSFGSLLNGNQANCNGRQPYGTQKQGPYRAKTSLAGTFPPNHWGIFDMHGNVSEWCTGKDPDPNRSERSSVHRGGSWADNAKDCRSARQGSYQEKTTLPTLGFRPVLVRVP